MKKPNLMQFSVKLSLYFMLILFFVMVSESCIIVLTMNNYVRRSQTNELKKAQETVRQTFISNFQTFLKSKEFYFELPYTVTYSIFAVETGNVLYTNDPMLPLLENSNGFAKKHFVKDYFSDGDLNILYISSNLNHLNQDFVIITALDIDNDYATKLVRMMPSIAVFAFLPLLFFSFLTSVFITTKMAVPFEREKQFSNDVSHELKTPLAIINGHVSLLLRWGKSDQKLLEESLQAVKKETKSMQKTIENLLQISRYESGRVKPEITEFSITDFYSRLQNEFFHLDNDEISPEKSRILIEIEKDFIIKSDQEMLHQIFISLISNSLKYNNYNCTIRLRAIKKGNSFILEEEDDGIGLDEKIIPFIFDRFFRGDSSHNQNIPGSGLGLSITKTLVKALNGKISAANATPKGALFKIEL